ncbi:MAG: CBS domain-containing protein [Chloroflexi bacterium]|nr:CBS domain-containing protein [Chloroflexota bacterium]
MRAKDIMTSPVVTIRPADTIDVAAARMLEKVVSCLVVVDENDFVQGILTHTDFGLRPKLLPLAENLYRLMGSWADPKTIEDIARKVGQRQVKEVMTKEVETGGEEEEVSKIVQKMLRRRVNRIPIVRDKKLVGIITRHDLLKLVVAGGRVADGGQEH